MSRIFQLLGGSAADSAKLVLAMAVTHTHEALRGLATLFVRSDRPLILSQEPRLRLFMSNACVTNPQARGYTAQEHDLGSRSAPLTTGD